MTITSPPGIASYRIDPFSERASAFFLPCVTLHTFHCEGARVESVSGMS